MTDGHTSLNILIAEDDLHLGEALAGFLRDRGHRVDLAANGREALEFLKDNFYSLVIADLVMPEADGLAVLRAARRKDEGTLVVIMTGHASLDSALEAIREGAYSYLRKPFKLQELDLAVANAARLLALSRENEELQARLQDLTAKLENFPLPEEIPLRRNQPVSGEFGFSSSGRDPDPGEQQVADLVRLHHLYRENLLTEGEYQRLKQRLCV
ncbi:MAG: response regulator [Deltaproteobacteria bacterium]|nr:response regulator [Deltaproteobacteria bacterium]